MPLRPPHCPRRFGGKSSVAAPTYAASFARGPNSPRSNARGAPLPLLAFPAPYGRAPPRTAGLRESGGRLRREFFSAPLHGANSAGWRLLHSRLRPVQRGGHCSLRSRCAPSLHRPPRPRPPSGRRALRVAPPSVGRVRARTIGSVPLSHCPKQFFVGLPKKPLHFDTPAAIDFFGNPPDEKFFRDKK